MGDFLLKNPPTLSDKGFNLTDDEFLLSELTSSRGDLQGSVGTAQMTLNDSARQTLLTLDRTY
jgi:hypothetical protein